jgi:hypothetical protein
MEVKACLIIVSAMKSQSNRLRGPEQTLVKKSPELLQVQRMLLMGWSEISSGE